MTFHLKEKLFVTIGILIFYLAIIAICICAKIVEHYSQDDRIFLILLVPFCGIYDFFKCPKETVIDVKDKTITVTRVFRFGKNKNVSRSFTYDDIAKIESRSWGKKSGHHIYLKTGETIVFPHGSDKGLDNFITNNLVTVLSAADPSFKAACDKHKADDKETDKSLIYLLVVSILLAIVCGLITSAAHMDGAFFFSLWIPLVLLAFIILLVISCTRGTATLKKQIAERRATDPQFDAAYRKQEIAQKEEQKRVDKLIIKISLFCLLLGYAASFLCYLIGMANMEEALCYGFFIGIAFFLAFAVIRGNLKNKN